MDLSNDLLDEIDDRNRHQMAPYCTELMRLFCARVNLTPLFVFFSEDETDKVDPGDASFSLAGINNKYLEYANSCRVGHLITWSKRVDDHEEFSELLAGIEESMMQLGLLGDEITNLFLAAEINLRKSVPKKG